MPSADRRLLLLPLAGLAVALGLGILLALWTLMPRVLPPRALLQLRPLHVQAALALLLGGICAAGHAFGNRLEAPRFAALSRLAAALLIGFFPIALLCTVFLHGAGREYFSWPPLLTLWPALAMALPAIGLLLDLRNCAARAPEAIWLLGLGLVCIPLGLAEHALASVLPLPFARAISYEWQALDFFFAGVNATLYGFGVLASRRPEKALRTRGLFLLAAFAFVSTFGHHHYLSPQPSAIKWLALVASLLGGVSFVRHLRAGRSDSAGSPPDRAADPLLRLAERWTLFAIGGGILFAVPQINLLVHGSYAVVGHAMGAMIGVGAMLVLACLMDTQPAREAAAIARITARARLADAALAAIVLDLTVAGLVKGWLRIDSGHAVQQAAMERILLPLPALGLLLAWAMLGLAREVWRGARADEAVPRAQRRRTDGRAAPRPSALQ